MTNTAKNCPECDQPMLPPGEVKRPYEYDHAQGCPLATPPADPPAEGAMRWEPGDNAITATEGVEVVLLRESVANGETHWLCRMAHPRKTGDHIPWALPEVRRAPGRMPSATGDTLLVRR